jgi:hypothetical protein
VATAPEQTATAPEQTSTALKKYTALLSSPSPSLPKHLQQQQLQ